MWIFTLRFIYGTCLTVIYQIFFLQFENSWTTTWPASPTNLSSLYSYFWGHLKVTVCATAVSDNQDLKQWIQNGLGMIWLTPWVFQQVRQSLFRRTTSCVEARRGQCEHFLWYSGSHNSDTMLQNFCIHNIYFSCIWLRFTFCRFGLEFFLSPCKLQRSWSWTSLKKLRDPQLLKNFLIRKTLYRQTIQYKKEEIYPESLLFSEYSRYAFISISFSVNCHLRNRY